MGQRIAELDLFFLSFDEPNAEKNWADLLVKAPWAKRVHGIKGFDNAHKACADRSSTDRFITVDADNLVDPAFFDLELGLDPKDVRTSVSWNGRNAINGLVYGNGGLKCWTKKMVQNMKTHENAESERAQVDFCWESSYKHIPGIYSTTYVNASPEQAFRTGLREGVKMCLDRGIRTNIDGFWKLIAAGNLNCLLVWMSVGRDVDNGVWAMLGSRYGAYHTLLQPEWDYRVIRDYEALREVWHTIWGEYEYFGFNDTWFDWKLNYFGKRLRSDAGLEIVDLSAETSRFFKAASVPPITGRLDG